jgi:hypothetical protein
MRKGKSFVNSEMQNNVTIAAQGYLNAVRQLGWFNVEEDFDTLAVIVPSLVDAGYDRAEILDVLARMGEDDEDMFETIVDTLVDDRPWMNWGRSLN